MSLQDFDPTDKQREILGLVFKAMDAGTILSFIDLMGMLSYGPISKQAMSCSLKFLRHHGAVELVYGDFHQPYKHGLRCYVKPTPAAYQRFKMTGSL